MNDIYEFLLVLVTVNQSPGNFDKIIEMIKDKGK